MQEGGGKTQREQAAHAIRVFLFDGPRWAADVWAHLRQLGFSDSVIEAAKGTAGIVSKGVTRASWWALKGDDRPGPERSPTYRQRAKRPTISPRGVPYRDPNEPPLAPLELPDQPPSRQRQRRGPGYMRSVADEEQLTMAAQQARQRAAPKPRPDGGPPLVELCSSCRRNRTSYRHPDGSPMCLWCQGRLGLV